MTVCLLQWHTNSGVIVESHQNLVLQVQAMKQDLDNRNKSVLMKMKRLHQAHEGLDSVLANARYKQKLMHKANQGLFFCSLIWTR